MTKRNFILCGLTGWCMEILWTGFQSLLSGDAAMHCATSLLMFPIYGCAAVILPVYECILFLPALWRGAVYAAGFFIVEFVSGTFLNFLGVCPWDYSGVPLSVGGVIRLDYAPLWAAAGLFFERMLVRQKNNFELSLKIAPFYYMMGVEKFVVDHSHREVPHETFNEPAGLFRRRTGQAFNSRKRY